VFWCGKAKAILVSVGAWFEGRASLDLGGSDWMVIRVCDVGDGLE